MSRKKRIIVNEVARAEEILKNGFSYGHVTIEELRLVAKYHVYIGIPNSKLEKSLIEFCYQHSQDFNEIRYRNLIDKMLRDAQKYPIKTGGTGVVITVGEWNNIRGYPRDYRKMLFVILCLAKNEASIIKHKSTDKFYYRISYAELATLCKLNYNAEEMMHFKHEVRDLIVPLENYGPNMKRIDFAEKQGEIMLLVPDVSKAIEYFPFSCDSCGKIIEATGRRQKYCKECWKSIHREKEKNRVW